MQKRVTADNAAPSRARAGSTDHPGRAVLCMLAGVALLTLNDAVVKTLTSSFPPGQLLFVRGCFVMPWILLIAWHAGGWSALRVRSFKGHALRGLCVIASAFLFINALTYLPLADAIAVAFTGPIFITAMAPIFLGEHVGWRRWAAVLAGFAGVLFMVRPGSGAMQWAILLPLFAAMFGGIRDLITRRISETESTVAVLAMTTSIVALAGLCTAPFGWSPLRTEHLPLFALSGFLLAGAHYLMIDAFRLGEAALVAPFKYSSLIWAIALGFLLFGDLPDGWTLLGAGIVISAGLYILHRERQRMRKPMTAVGPSARL